MPELLGFGHDVTRLERMVRGAGVATIGSVEARSFPWPRDREEALRLLEHFLEHGLRDFGRFQDAMSSQHPVLFHSRQSEGRRADIHQVEGFVRQILGWREYLRGVYWERMPEYAGCNYFEHRRSLPGWYWSARTSMGERFIGTSCAFKAGIYPIL